MRPGTGAEVGGGAAVEVAVAGHARLCARLLKNGGCSIKSAAWSGD